MNFLPKVRACPNCQGINILNINGKTYDNHFQSLIDWTLKKIFKCRKCSIKLGLFINNLNQKQEKIIWFDFFKCEESYLNKLKKLQKNKIKYKEKDKTKEYEKTIKEIQDIQNQIRLDQVKIKVKTKIQNRGMLI